MAMNVLCRFLFATAGSLLLSGCVLQSPAPLFGDTQGAPALQALGKTFTMESFTDGKWQVEEGLAVLIPMGRHYLMSNPDGKPPTEVLFVPLDGSRFAVQARESREKPFVYLVAEIGKGEVLLTLLDCDELKKAGKFGDDITFDGGDCTFARTPEKPLFLALAGALGAAKSRWRPAQ